MFKKLLFIFVATLITANIALADENLSVEAKPTLKVFTNFSAPFEEDAAVGFNLDRVYLGTKYSFGKEFSGKVVLDIGNPKNGSSLERTAYVKNAYITWNKNNFSLSGGLVGTKQFKVQEKSWGYRYIAKSFQDGYKYGASADAGIVAAYKIGKVAEIDLSVLNGEGYKTLNSDNNFRYGLGLTVKPVKGLTLRVYGDMHTFTEPEEDSEGMANQMNVNAFLGYSHDKFSIGAEYNMLQNVKWVENQNFSGLSAYGKVNLCKKANVFARYDMQMSNTLDGMDDPWHLEGDESALYLGVEWKAAEILKLAPNFRMVMPAEDGADAEMAVFVNCEFKI